MERTPKGELAIRVIAMPKHTNYHGDIFGGWVLSQMDLAAGYLSRKHTKHRTVTIALDAMKFIAPVHVGDVVCCYGEVIKTGRTSITLAIETWARTHSADRHRLVTEGRFVFVAIDDQGKSTPL